MLPVCPEYLYTVAAKAVFEHENLARIAGILETKNFQQRVHIYSAMENLPF